MNFFKKLLNINKNINDFLQSFIEDAVFEINEDIFLINKKYYLSYYYSIPEIKKNSGYHGNDILIISESQFENNDIKTIDIIKIFVRIIRDDKKEQFKKEFKDLISVHIRKIIKKGIKEKTILYCLNGWNWLEFDIKDKLDYVNVTEAIEFPIGISDLFVSYPSKFKKTFINDESGEKAIKQTLEIINNLYNIINSNKALIPIISYVFMSVAKNGIKLLAERRDFFDEHHNILENNVLLCLYGKQNYLTTPSAIANIFFNICSSHKRLDIKHIHVLPKNIAIFIDNLNFEKHLNAVIKYNDVPIIFTSKEQNITKSNPQFKSIYKKIETGDIKHFPVFISNAKIDVENVISINTDDIKTPINKQDYRNIQNTIQECIYHLIYFIRSLSFNNNLLIKFKDFLLTSKVNEILNNSEIDINIIEYTVQLYYCFNFFVNSMKCIESENYETQYNEIKEKTDKLNEWAYEIIFNMSKCKILPQEDINIDLLKIFISHIKDIFINKCITPSYCFWENEEKENNIYFISYHEILEDFENKIKNNEKLNILDLDIKKRIVKLLKDKGLIKFKKGSFGLERIHNNEKKYVLALYKDKIMEIINN